MTTDQPSKSVGWLFAIVRNAVRACDADSALRGGARRSAVRLWVRRRRAVAFFLHKALELMQACGVDSPTKRKNTLAAIWMRHLDHMRPLTHCVSLFS